MKELLNSITIYDIMIAAVLAFFVTHVILRFQYLRRFFSNHEELSMDYKGIDISAVMKQCKTMFPIEVISFRGKVFHQGMKVRITTMKKKIIEGELVGKNDLNILCVLTSRHVIAHEIDSIEDIVELNTEQK